MKINLNNIRQPISSPNLPEVNEKNTSWKKPLLYTALAVAGVGTAAILAYKYGIFSSNTIQPACPKRTVDWSRAFTIEQPACAIESDAVCPKPTVDWSKTFAVCPRPTVDASRAFIIEQPVCAIESGAVCPKPTIDYSFNS